jgi:polyhydroxyalkanoate synthesis regulator phasin
MGPLEDKLDQQVERVVDRLNIPTKSDVDALSSRIADLSRKIDELNQQ